MNQPSKPTPLEEMAKSLLSEYSGATKVETPMEKRLRDSLIGNRGIGINAVMVNGHDLEKLLAPSPLLEQMAEALRAADKCTYRGRNQCAPCKQLRDAALAAYDAQKGQSK